MERIIYANEAFCAVEENRRLVEYIPVREEDQTGRILYGKVNRIMAGLEAAFVDIGRERDGFLPLRENSNSFTEPDFRSGDRVLVQIRREETGKKGAALSRDISLPGSYLILMPMNRHIGISARIQDPALQEKLLRTGRELAAGRFGLVMREASASVDTEILHREMEQLEEQWEKIRNGGASAPEVSPYKELVRDYTPRGISRIERVDTLPPDLLRQLKEGEQRKIRLPHGGNIVIDRCEALTVIDVNSASDTGQGNRREAILRTNTEACKELMIQTRLRNLSGILIIDLIDMDHPEDQELILEELRKAAAGDRIKTVIHGFTSLGLLEMTRKRSRNTWQEKACM